MPSPKSDAQGLALLVLAIGLYLWWTGRKVANSSTITNTGCGCHGASAGGFTTPRNPSASNRGSSPVLTGAPRGSGANVPPSVPGSNASASGSGGNWQGANTSPGTSLSPPTTPSAPSIATGSNVWVAHSKPAVVRAS
jgi:hypothetical protein